MRTPLGPERCPYFRSELIHARYYIVTQKSVLIIEVSLFQGVLISRLHCTVLSVTCPYLSLLKASKAAFQVGSMVGSMKKESQISLSNKYQSVLVMSE